MRFLVDECLPRRLAALLTDAGHPSVHVVDAGLAGKPDAEVMRHARDESRVLLSAYTDFGELLASAAQRTPSVVLFRRSLRRAEQFASVLLANVDEFAGDLDAGALVVIGEERVRIRALPMR